MKYNHKQEQEVNFAGMTLEDFLAYYNNNIPDSMPRATKESLEEFLAGHEALFGEDKAWTIDKHRRRFMDWLISYHTN